MNRRLFGAFGAIAVVGFALGNCKSDPLSDLDGNPAALVTDFTYLEVNVAATRPVTAYVVDGRSTPLAEPVTFTACSGVITVGPDTAYHPVPATSSRAVVHGVTFGTSCVVVQGGGFTDTVQVATFPAAIVVTSGPDTVQSGDTVGYTFQYRDAVGAPVAGVPAPAWSSGDTLRARISADAGMLSGLDTGLVTIRVTGTGSPAGGVSGTKQLYIRPAAFTGSVVPNPADPGQVVKLVRGPTAPIFDANSTVRFGASNQTIVTGSLTPDSVKVAIPDLAAAGALGVGTGRLGPTDITQSGGVLTVNIPAALDGSASPSSGLPATEVVISRTSGPVFDANTRVYFNGIQSLITSVSASQIVVPAPGIGKTGPVELRLTRLDAGDFARRLTFTADTGVFLFADQYDAVNDNPTAGPAITANGNYYIVQHGVCAGGVGGAGDDCDDFFTLTNSSGAPDTLTVQATWLGNADVDILFMNAGGTGFVGNFNGATAANPEASTVVMPVGATWRLWLNLFAPGAAASTTVRVTVSGKN